MGLVPGVESPAPIVVLFSCMMRVRLAPYNVADQGPPSSVLAPQYAGLVGGALTLPRA